LKATSMYNHLLRLSLAVICSIQVLLFVSIIKLC